MAGPGHSAEHGGAPKEAQHHNAGRKGGGGKGMIGELIEGISEVAWNNGLGFGESALYKGGKSSHGAGGPKHPVG